jgi:hypothetical protein
METTITLSIDPPEIPVADALTVPLRGAPRPGDAVAADRGRRRRSSRPGVVPRRDAAKVVAMSTLAFTGHIAGVGTSSGTRVVLGLWDETPFGPVADAMVEEPSGHRTLVAPDQDLADFIATTYAFDEVLVEPVARQGWAVRSEHLDVRVVPGRSTAVGRLLRLVPAKVGRTRRWARTIDPLARVAMPGVRTHGTAGNGRVEWYSARGVRRIEAVDATWRGVDLGTLAPVAPPVRFGFASAPRAPSLTALTSYVTI